MFYQKGIDITKAKSMFDYIAAFKTYEGRPAHNMKVYNLGLSNYKALDYLNATEYVEINYMIEDFARANPGCEIYAAGRSGGYAVLYLTGYDKTLFDYIKDFDNYEDFKEFCRDDFAGSVKETMPYLVRLTKNLQAFDKWCDEVRDFCESISHQNIPYLLADEYLDIVADNYSNIFEALGIEFTNREVRGENYRVYLTAEVNAYPEVAGMIKRHFKGMPFKTDVVLGDDSYIDFIYS